MPFCNLCKKEVQRLSRHKDSDGHKKQMDLQKKLPPSERVYETAQEALDTCVRESTKKNELAYKTIVGIAKNQSELREDQSELRNELRELQKRLQELERKCMEL
jgi:hypothetical protein